MTTLVFCGGPLHLTPIEIKGIGTMYRDRDGGAAGTQWGDTRVLGYSKYSLSNRAFGEPLYQRMSRPHRGVGRWQDLPPGSVGRPRPGVYLWREEREHYRIKNGTREDQETFLAESGWTRCAGSSWLAPERPNIRRYQTSFKPALIEALIELSKRESHSYKEQCEQWLAELEPWLTANGYWSAIPR